MSPRFSGQVKRQKKEAGKKKKRRRVRRDSRVCNNETERTGLNSTHIFTSQQGQNDLESHTAVDLECTLRNKIRPIRCPERNGK